MGIYIKRIRARDPHFIVFDVNNIFLQPFMDTETIIFLNALNKQNDKERMSYLYFFTRALIIIHLPNLL